ncbi:MAG: hypothetical protein QF524_08355 [Planctomycetota bacterium]|jgi:hypothetical protein|nr:hypothetical protein [Planctomycetota bacterium]MDP7560437.1 hypothetical protein [Planctomycetota bacterium]
MISLIPHPGAEGIQVSPSVYFTAKEVGRFIEIIRHAAKHGLD